MRLFSKRRYFLPCTIAIIVTFAATLTFCKLFLAENRLNSDVFFQGQQTSNFNIALALDSGVNGNMEITNTDGSGSNCKLTPTALTTSGTLINCKVTVTVSTNTSYGYTASISSQSGSTYLAGSGNAIGVNIPTTTGTVASPIALTNGTWGYAVPKAKATVSNGFDTTYTVGEKDTGNSANATFTNAKYAQIPASSNPTTIRTVTSQVNSDTFEIYFATRLSYSQLAGNYGGGVTIAIKSINAASVLACQGSSGSSIRVDIDANMVPITYTGSTSTPTWTKASGSNWCNYDSAKWANAVTLDNTTVKYNSSGGTSSPTLTALGYFKNAGAGVTIPEADILGYYVYIPRYEYQVCRPNASNAISFASGSEPNDGAGNKCPTSLAAPYNFNIRFQNKTQTTTFNGTAGRWATHPAFTLTDNSTSTTSPTITQLNGIWVGKFEATGSTSAPTIKPNLTSLRNITLAAQLNAAKSIGKIALNGTSTNAANRHNFSGNADASIISNRGWGAVAYLATSKYGRGTSEVWTNPNSSYLTGCAGASVSAAQTTACNQYYTTNGLHASTTNNVYGIYDMAGGSWESTLANYSNGTNVGRVGSSGFTAGTAPRYFSGINNKYFDLYQSTTFTNNNQFSNNNQCTWAQCGGHAYHETKAIQSVTANGQSWNSDYSYFVYSDVPWVVRGATMNEANNLAGIFATSWHNGGVYIGLTFRVVVYMP